MTRREQAKAERRDRIVKAAITLTENAGIDGFSMRDLAREAGVSHATPFNLFGSKAKIISQIFDADLQSFRAALLSRYGPGDVNVFFGMIQMAMVYFHRKETLYRSLHADFQLRASGDLLQRFNEPRLILFAELASALQDAGVLDPTLSPELIGSSCYNLWQAVMLRWVRGAVTLDRMHHEVAFGIAGLLSGFATPGARPKLQEQMRAYHSAILETAKQSTDELAL